MSRPVRISWPAADTAAVATAQQPPALGSFIIDGTLSSSGVATFTNLERVVTITSGGNVSGTNYTITGTLRGDVVSQTIAGPNAGTVSTLQAFTTVTSVTVGIVAPLATARIGSGTTGSTIWYKSDYYRTRSSLLVAVFVENGVVDYTFETTPDDVFNDSIQFITWNGIDGVTTPTIPANNPMINCTDDSMANYTFPTSYSRIYINSSGANTNLDITFLEQGIK